jgi:DNA-binding CsgD family transcriptional regulator
VHVTHIALAQEILEEAVFEPETLPDAFAKAGRALGFDHFCLVHANLEAPTFIGSDSALVFLNEYAKDGWLAADYRADFVNRVPDGTVFSDETMTDAEGRKATAIYNELYVKHGIESFAGWRHSISDQAWIFLLARSADKGPIGEVEMETLRQIRSVANRTARLAYALREARLDGALEGLALKGSAAILLSVTGRVMAATPAAERLFDAEFNVRQNMLWANHPNSRAALATLATPSGNGGPPPGPSPIVIHRRSPRRPLLATPHPARGMALDALTGAHTLLIVTSVDDDVHSGPVATGLRLLFNLSPAEAEIAGLLANGLTLQDIADARGVGRETVRAQIKRVFDKLDVRRQAEVVRVVERLRLPPAGPQIKAPYLSAPSLIVASPP